MRLHRSFLLPLLLLLLLHEQMWCGRHGEQLLVVRLLEAEQAGGRARHPRNIASEERWLVECEWGEWGGWEDGRGREWWLVILDLGCLGWVWVGSGLVLGWLWGWV